MTHFDDQKREEAVSWFLSLRDPMTADWDGFTTWLEQDQVHGEIYEEVALADGAYGDLQMAAALPLPSNDNPASDRWQARHIGWAMAAVAMIGAVAYPLLDQAPATYAIETAPGQRNSVSLDDGTRIDLNGDTKITLKKGDNRFASLDRGEARFTVIHDASNPFTVHVGEDQIQDVGTVFNVVRNAHGLETAVASGAVLYNPGRETVRVDAGRRLQSSAGSMALTNIAPADVAAWRMNKLIYKDVALETVAADLSRNLGTPVHIAPDIAMQRFSGVIMLDGDKAKLLPKIGPLLDVTIAHDVDGWRMSSQVRDRQ